MQTTLADNHMSNSDQNSMLKTRTEQKLSAFCVILRLFFLQKLLSRFLLEIRRPRRINHHAMLLPYFARVSKPPVS